ncbi:MAG: SYNERG-CTERM sorting domain-containing protein [Synergistes sp.]|nr:SYNERG-CTERM sorting domain-containing protein [Synergistes sp.]
MFKKRGLLALVLALCMALTVSPAMADILYTASTNWNTDRFGLIKGDADPTKDVVTNLGGDAGSGVFSFKNADKKARVAVSQYAYAGNDTVWFYDPETTDWSAPMKEAVSPVKNVHHMVAEGKYLFAAGYDDASVGRFDMTADEFAPDDKTFTCTPEEPGYTAHAERLAAHNGSIYAIFTASSGSYPNYVYAYHKLVKLKEDLTEEASAPLKGKNLDGANVGSTLQVGKDLYVASIGGSQDTSGLFNTDSMIEKVDLETLTSETLITAADAAEKDKEWGYNFYGLAKDGDKIYVLAACWNGSWPESGTDNVLIYETTAEKLGNGDLGEKIATLSTKTGYSLGIEYDSESKLLWVSAGDSMYKYDGTDFKEFDKTALGGDMAKFAALKASEVTPSDGGSSGCNSGFGALALLALLPLIASKRGKK